MSMKEKLPDKENDALPNVSSSTPNSMISILLVYCYITFWISRSCFMPYVCRYNFPLFKSKYSTIVLHDLVSLFFIIGNHESFAIRRRGRPRLTDITNTNHSNIPISVPVVEHVTNKRKANENPITLKSGVTKGENKKTALPKKNIILNPGTPLVDIAKRPAGRPARIQPHNDITQSTFVS